MGLDIYVRFGEISEDEDGYKEHVGWFEENGKYHDYWEDQITGYQSAPYAGYLRESWGSLAWVSEMAESIGAPMPYTFFPEWEGSNGEELDLSNGKLEQVLSFRDGVLRPWLRNRESFLEHYRQAKSDRNEERAKELTAFKERVCDVIGFINFVELHKDKPNLTVVFG